MRFWLTCVISDVPLALVWWYQGGVVVGQTSQLQGAAQPPLLPLLSRLYCSSCSTCAGLKDACNRLLVFVGEGVCEKTIYNILALLPVVTSLLDVCVVVVVPTVWSSSSPQQPRALSRTYGRSCPCSQGNISAIHPTEGVNFSSSQLINWECVVCCWSWFA